jgi:hypothetical protein
MPKSCTNLRWPLSKPPSRAKLSWALGATVCLAIIPLSGAAESEKESRYPYDPACAWGRLANGKGMIHRCLSEEEARRLAAGQALEPPTPNKTAPPAAPAADAGPANSAVADATGGEKTADTAPNVKPNEYTLTVGPIVAEQGDITIGKLAAPIDRYRACIDANGGLEASRGKLVVSFLVQAARSRAEGVEVSKVQGISKKAAQCIAEVIDRRRVGTPSEETTGAKLTIELIGK